MDDERYRTLVVLTHPIQYSTPTLREMANHPKIDPLVAYCSMQTVKPTLDPDFGVEVAWDIPLLGGYRWVQVPNQSPRAGLGRFFGLFNFGLWRMIRSGTFDAVVILTGYRYASFWIVLAAAKSIGIPVLFGTDAHQLNSRDGNSWKVILKNGSGLIFLDSQTLLSSLRTAEYTDAITQYPVRTNRPNAICG